MADVATKEIEMARKPMFGTAGAVNRRGIAGVRQGVRRAVGGIVKGVVKRRVQRHKAMHAKMHAKMRPGGRYRMS